jgi:adenosylcobinamide-GDP ribazoletransferase
MRPPGEIFARSRGFLTGFALAVTFLTRLPMAKPFGKAGRLADAAWAFPLVGAGIGAVAGFIFLLGQVLRLGDWLAALLAVLAGIALTGALHEDGLADTADGLIGGRDRDHALAIMRDSRNGTFGVLAIVLSVLLRVAALVKIGDSVHVLLALISAHSASRAVLPVAMRLMMPARADGLGASAGRPHAAFAVLAGTIGTLISLAALDPRRSAMALGILGAAVFGAGLLAQRRIGGYTGDILGAFQQIGEIAMLLTAAAR